MNKEIQFLLTVLRNGVILAGLYFISMWAASSGICWQIVKPLIIFLATYVLTELAKRYGINKELSKPEEERSVLTMIL